MYPSQCSQNLSGMFGDIYELMQNKTLSIFYGIPAGVSGRFWQNFKCHLILFRKYYISCLQKCKITILLL